mgnify:CR=1 FL=1
MAIQVEVCVQDVWAETVTATATGDIASDTWATWMSRWLEHLAPALSPIHAYELSLRLTGDREIKTLNHTYRQIDQPTDVLAFAALESELPPDDELQQFPLYLGDIIISVETAERQAQTQAHSLQLELAWLVAHGLLHLLGWDHPDDDSLMAMLDQQRALLCTVGLSMGAS